LHVEGDLVEIGLLLIRVVIGALFVGHGLQKLRGWFQGPGIAGTTGMFGSLGYRKPRLMAVGGGLTETVAGALLILGFLTPLAAAGIIGVMINAIWTVHRENGLWVSEGGYEYNLVIIAAVTGLAITGPGLWAVDPAAGLPLAGPVWGLFSLVVGLLAGAAVLTGLRVPEPAATEAEQPQEAAEQQDRRAA
jgi:putative oxidoreductase